MSGTNCSPLVKRVQSRTSSVQLDVAFSLELQADAKIMSMTPEVIFNTSTAIMNDMTRKLSMLKTKTELCSIKIDVKLKRGNKEVIMGMYDKRQVDLSNDFDYIAVSACFKSSTAPEIHSLVANMTMLLTTALSFGYFQITYRKSNDSVYQYEPNVTSCNNATLELHSKLYLDQNTLTSLCQSYNDPANGKGIIPVIDNQYKLCKSGISLEPAPFCAKFKASSDIIEEATAHGVNVTIRNRSLFFHSFVESDSEYCIYLCWDEYIVQLELQSSLMHASNSNDDGELSVLTIVCIAFSIASLVLTLCVYIILTKLRSVPGLNNMALCVSLIISQALTLLNSATTISTPEICAAIGILLHFSLLSGFFWMFICTYHMAKTFVNLKVKSTSETNTKSIFIWYTVFVEGISLAVIACVFVYGILVEHTPMVYGGTPCYVQGKTSILYFVAIPVGAVIVTNLSMFILVIVKISSLPDMAESSTRERKNLVIFAKLSTVTGLTWIFGFLYQFSAVQLFAYLFILFNAGQGVFIMLAFVTNGRVYTMMKNREWSQKQGKYSSSQTRTGAQSNHSGRRDTHNTNVSSNNAE